MTWAQRRRLRISRDTALFAVGLAGVVYETLWVDVDRPALLVLFGGMLGLPALLRSDERHQPVPPKPGEVRPSAAVESGSDDSV